MKKGLVYGYAGGLLVGFVVGTWHQERETSQALSAASTCLARWESLIAASESYRLELAFTATGRPEPIPPYPPSPLWTVQASE